MLVQKGLVKRSVQNIVKRPGPNDIHFSTLVGSPFPSGKRFILLPEEGSTLCQLEVAEGSMVETIKLCYLDRKGHKNFLQAGKNSANTCKLVSLSVPVAGLRGTSGWYLDSLRIDFKDGSSSPLFGGIGGDTGFALHLHKKDNVWQGEIVGFWGVADHHGIEALGIIFGL